MKLLGLLLTLTFQLQGAILLHINEEASLRLSVEIPRGFWVLEPKETWAEQNEIHLFPEGETEESWTRQIVIYQFPGKRVLSPQDLLRHLKQRFPPRSGLWRELVLDKFDYFQITLGLTYPKQYQREIVAFQFYASPYDICGVSYLLCPPLGQTSQDAFKEIEAFFKTLKVI